jgi:hypothetical protein
MLYGEGSFSNLIELSINPYNFRGNDQNKMMFFYFQPY